MESTLNKYAWPQNYSRMQLCDRRLSISVVELTCEICLAKWVTRRLIHGASADMQKRISNVASGKSGFNFSTVSKCFSQKIWF